MLSSEFLTSRRNGLRARAVSIKPSEVVLRRRGQDDRTITARVNYPSGGSFSRTQQTQATDAQVLAFTLVSDDPALDIKREDRIICTGQGGQVLTGRIIAVRAESWGVEADAAQDQ